MVVRANISFLVEFCLAIFLFFTSVLGCGQLPQGEMTAMTFTASGFTLPAEMVYSGAPAVRNIITSISHTKDAAILVVRNLIMNAVNDVLEEQGRNALLPNAVTLQILQQLNINIDCSPLECLTVSDKQTNVPILAMKGGCLIIDNLVTSLCMKDMNPQARAGAPPIPGCTLMPMIMHVEPIPPKYRTIKGSLKSSNVLMANWSKQMWQSVLNRVSEKLATGRFGKSFSTAIVTVDN